MIRQMLVHLVYLMDTYLMMLMRMILKRLYHFTMMLPCNIILTPTVIDLVTKMVDDLDRCSTKENIYNMIF